MDSEEWFKGKIKRAVAEKMLRAGPPGESSGPQRARRHRQPGEMQSPGETGAPQPPTQRPCLPEFG